jgi:hypothetical protein
VPTTNTSVGSTLALRWLRPDWVAPLGSTSLIFNFLFASWLVGTRECCESSRCSLAAVTATDIRGTAVIILGVILILVFSSINHGLQQGLNIERYVLYPIILDIPTAHHLQTERTLDKSIMVGILCLSRLVYILHLLCLFPARSSCRIKGILLSTTVSFFTSALSTCQITRRDCLFQGPVGTVETNRGHGSETSRDDFTKSR